MRTHLVAGPLLLLASFALGAAPPEPAPIRLDSDADRRKALLELNELSGTDPMRGRLKQLIDDRPERTKKLLATAAKMAKEKPQPFNRNTTFLLAMAAENAKEVSISAQFYRLNVAQSMAVGSERAVAVAYLGLIQTYQDNGKFSECEKACREALEVEADENGDLEGARPAIMRSMVTAVARKGEHDRALKLIDGMLQADSRNWLNLALKGRILRGADKLEEAARVYLDVIKKVEKETRLKEAARLEYVDDYRYALSGIYAELGEPEKAAAQLKLLVEREPDNPTYNNDLGFTYAEQGENLEEAEKLIRKALDDDRKQRKASPLYDADKDRDSAAYLDSLGWVLFKQGKPKEAKPHLLEAVKYEEGQHTEVYDHLAEVHVALGEKAEAVAAWKKAVEAATSSKRDQKRKEQIEKKLEKLQEK